jgi:hypothetical protein
MKNLSDEQVKELASNMIDMMHNGAARDNPPGMISALLTALHAVIVAAPNEQIKNSIIDQCVFLLKSARSHKKVKYSPAFGVVPDVKN